MIGYYRYHAVPGNLDRLRVFGQRIRRLWRLVLSRRSQCGTLPWDRLKPLFALDSSTPGPTSIPDGTLHRHSSEVGAVCIEVHVRFCAGATSNGRPYRVINGSCFGMRRLVC